VITTTPFVPPEGVQNTSGEARDGGLGRHLVPAGRRHCRRSVVLWSVARRAAQGRRQPGGSYHTRQEAYLRECLACERRALQPHQPARALLQCDHCAIQSSRDAAPGHERVVPAAHIRPGAPPRPCMRAAPRSPHACSRPRQAGPGRARGGPSAPRRGRSGPQRRRGARWSFRVRAPRAPPQAHGGPPGSANADVARPGRYRSCCRSLRGRAPTWGRCSTRTRCW